MKQKTVFVLVISMINSVNSEDCLAYTTYNGDFQSLKCKSFDLFCCGDCYFRFCCSVLSAAISNQKDCHNNQSNNEWTWILGMVLGLLFAMCVCSCCIVKKNRAKQRTIPTRNNYPMQTMQLNDSSNRSPPGPAFQTNIIGPGIYIDLNEPTSTTNSTNQKVVEDLPPAYSTVVQVNPRSN